MKKVGILNCFELLNENVLQALLQGYVQAEVWLCISSC